MSALAAPPRRPSRRSGTLQRDARVQIRAVSAAERTVEALVSVFNVPDSYGDVMKPGSFRQTLLDWERKGDPIPFVWSHQWQDPEAFIGGVERAAETVDGLLVKARLYDDTETARKVYQLLSERLVTQFSFAFEYRKTEPTREVTADGIPIQNVLAVDLIEVGPCLRGANPSTQLVEVRAAASRPRTSRVYAFKSATAPGVQERWRRTAKLHELEAMLGPDPAITARLAALQRLLDAS